MGKKAAMKTMKKAAMKTMKKAAMKKTVMKKAMKKAMKKKTVATGKLAKLLVFRGSRVKTSGGLKKDKLTKNKDGKVVSAAMSKAGKKSYARIRGWTNAVQKARAALKVKGFVAIKKGTPLYKKAKEIYTASK